MKITIDNRLRITGAPKQVHDHLNAELTLTNPKYVDAVKMGRWLGSITKHIYGCHCTTDGTLILPRGYVHQLQRYLKENSIPHQIEDKRRISADVDFKFNGTLKPFQVQACDAMIAGGSFGTLMSGTGSGKTVMALNLIAERKKPAIVIVHTKELLEQWILRIEQFLGIPADEVGVIGSGKLKVGTRITVSLVQSLYKCARGVAPAIGHLIVDETHRCPSRTYNDAVSSFDCEYMLGLSATPYRRDGLTKLIFWYIGDLQHEVDQDALKENGTILKADVIVRRTEFTPFYDPINEYSKMLSELVADMERNKLIAADVAAESKNDSGILLVLSDRKAHLLSIQELLLSLHWIQSNVLTGDIPTKQRKELVQRLNAGEIKILLATGSLIGEGFDLAGLQVLFLATPVKFSGRLLQYLGRVLRPAPGKEKALVYDYVDFNVGPLIASYKSRAKVYRKV